MSDVYYVKIIDDSTVPPTASVGFTGLSLTVTYIHSGTTFAPALTNKLVKITDKAAGTYVEDATTVAADGTNSSISSKKLVFALSGLSEYVFYIK